MKNLPLFIFSLLLVGNNNLFGQVNREDAFKAIFPYMPSEERSNVDIIVLDPINLKPQPCPANLTNLFTNRKLFMDDTAEHIKVLASKYKDATTNSGPPGTIFSGWVTKAHIFQQHTNLLQVACFTNANVVERDEISTYIDERQIIVIHRNSTGDGYNLMLDNGALKQYEEYKHGIIDGPFVLLSHPSDPNLSLDKCYFYVCFVKGKAIGPYIAWDQNGNIVCEFQFNKPFDVLKYSASKMDLSWDSVASHVIK